MKMKIVLSIAIFAMVQMFLAGMAPDVKAVPIGTAQGLFNTGVDDTGGVLTHGQKDAHYDITGALTQPDPYVLTGAGAMSLN